MSKLNDAEMSFWGHLDDLRNTLFQIASLLPMNRLPIQ